MEEESTISHFVIFWFCNKRAKIPQNYGRKKNKWKIIHHFTNFYKIQTLNFHPFQPFLFFPSFLTIQTAQAKKINFPFHFLSSLTKTLSNHTKIPNIKTNSNNSPASTTTKQHKTSNSINKTTKQTIILSLTSYDQGLHRRDNRWRSRTLC